MDLMNTRWYSNSLRGLCASLETRFLPSQHIRAAADLLVQQLIMAPSDQQAEVVGYVVNALASAGAGDMLRDQVIDALQAQKGAVEVERG